MSEHALAQLIDFLGIPKQCIEPLIRIVREHSACSRAGISPHIQELIKGLFSTCFWQLSGSDTYAKPTIGFSPGTGLADLAFTCVYRLFLVVVQQRLTCQGYATRIDVQPALQVFPIGDMQDDVTTDVTWVDDTVFMVPFKDSLQVLDVTHSVARIALGELRIRGFTPNMKLGKTTVMPILLGPNAQKAFDLVFVDSAAHTSIRDDFGNTYDLHFAMNYKHLGSHKDIKRSMVLESNFRIGQCSAAMKKLSRPLRKAWLLPPQKWNFCFALAVTKLTFDSWTDARVTKSTFNKLEATYSSIARRCTIASPHVAHTSITYAVARCHAVPHSDHMRYTRLAYFARLIRSGTSFLHRLLEHTSNRPHSYLGLVRTDLEWLFRDPVIAAHYPSLDDGIADFISSLYINPKPWKATLKRHKKAHISFYNLTHVAGHWNHDVQLKLDEIGLPRTASQAIVPVLPVPEYHCHCGFICKTAQQLCIHSIKAHNWRGPAYGYLTDDGKCVACLRVFHTRFRLLSHLKRFQKGHCLHTLQRFYKPWYVGEPSMAAWGKASQSNAVCRKGPAVVEDRLKVLRGAGPLLSPFDFGDTSLEPHLVADQVPDSQIPASTLPPHNVSVPLEPTPTTCAHTYVQGRPHHRFLHAQPVLRAQAWR
jgi:hypothetical protein